MKPSTPPSTQSFQEYLNGNLTEADKAAFERRMMQNPELNHQVNKQRFEDSISKQQSKKQNRKKVSRFLLALLILSSSIFVFYNFSNKENLVVTPSSNTTEQSATAISSIQPMVQSPNTEVADSRLESVVTENRSVSKKSNLTTKSPNSSSPTELSLNEYTLLAKNLYTASDYPTGHTPSNRAASTKADVSFTSGLNFYKTAKKMEQAIAAFQKISKAEHPDIYEDAQLYLGHAYFKTGQYKAAAKVFTPLAQKGSQLEKEQNEWFLLLSLLPTYQSNQQQVSTILDKMLQPDQRHSQYRMAVYLKEDLEKLESFN